MAAPCAAERALSDEAFLHCHPLSARPGVEEVELNRLELPFEAFRVPAPRRLEALIRSMDRCGQLSALVAVPDTGSRLVLVDGYLRVRALRRLGADTAWVEVWQCELSEALLGMLAASQCRGWDAIEEALLIRELTGVLGLSQHAVAQRTGRDVSWVNRRLKLVESLSEELLEAVCQGRALELGGECASSLRWRAPTPTHAHALLATAVRTQPLYDPRAAGRWYQPTIARANRTTRERLVDAPARCSCAGARRANARRRPRANACARGPKGECLADLRCLEAVLKRLRRRLASDCAHTSMPDDLRAGLYAHEAGVRAPCQRRSTKVPSR